MVSNGSDSESLGGFFDVLSSQNFGPVTDVQTEIDAHSSLAQVGSKMFMNAFWFYKPMQGII